MKEHFAQAVTSLIIRNIRKQGGRVSQRSFLCGGHLDQRGEDHGDEDTQRSHAGEGHSHHDAGRA